MRVLREAWLVVAVLLRRRPWAFLLLLPLLTAVMLLAMRIGEAAPALPVYLDAGDCSQPCWQGLQPGTTHRDEVLAFARQHPLSSPGSLEVSSETASSRPYIIWETRYFPSYDVQARFYQDTLMRLDLYVDGRLQLGDVIEVLGEPSHAQLCYRISTGINYRSAVFATLYFYEGSVEVWAYLANAAIWQVRPDMQVFQIVYRTPAPDDESWIPLSVGRWHGFGRRSYSAYCL